MAKSSQTTSRPTLIAMSPAAGKISPGIMVLSDRSVNGDELCAVGKGGLDLHVVNDLGDALHDGVARHDMGAGLHQVGDGAAVARALHDEVADQGDGLGMVELD